MNIDPIRRPWAVALLAAFAGLAWQTAIVETRFGENWTGLFYCGEKIGVPPELAAGTYIHRGGDGYDAQFYRLTAHDPLNRKGYSSYLDLPAYRRNRAFVPLLAWITAAGQAPLIDWTYIGIITTFVGLGAYYMAQVSVTLGSSPLFGLAFVLLPSTLQGIDRLLPDVALTASFFAFMHFRERNTAAAWLALAAGCATRDLGLLVIAAAAGHALFSRQWVRTVQWASAALPAVLWWGAWYGHMIPPNPPESSVLPVWLFSFAPLQGYWLRISDPFPYETYAWLIPVFRGLDVISMIALPAAGFAALWLWWRGRALHLEWQCLLPGLLVLLVNNPGFLRDDYSYPRSFTVLLAPLLLVAIRNRNPLYALPAAIVSARVLAVMAMELGPLARSVLGLVRP